MRDLTPLEARVLGVLVEKAATVPDTYPLSLNALVAGCNQKTAREPVINATDAEVLTAIDGLKRSSLVFEASSTRVTRYEHNAARGLNVDGASVALLAVLMLRGPQTAAELRANAERLHRFSDIAAVEACLQALAERYPPRAVRLERAPGARESRWAHLLSGEAALPAAIASGPFEPSAAGGVAAADAVSAGELAALKGQIERQGDELARLRALVLRMAAELGIDPADQPPSPASD